MIEQRKNNYYRISGTGPSFKVNIDPVTRPVKTYCEELILAAQEIYETREKDLFCLYSGGIDSELIMEVFLSQGMKITPVIVAMDGHNEYDIAWAKKYCEQKQIQPLIVNIDIEKFITSGEIVNLADRLGAYSYHQLPILKVALELDGEVLPGDDEPYICPDGDVWYYLEKEVWAVWDRLYENKMIQGTQCFLSWSAESFLAFLKEPAIVKLGNNLVPGKKGTYSSRKFVYNRMFPMIERPKYTGWEQIEQGKLIQHENLRYVKEMQDQNYGSYKIAYNELINQMSSKINGKMLLDTEPKTV